MYVKHVTTSISRSFIILLTELVKSCGFKIEYVKTGFAFFKFQMSCLYFIKSNVDYMYIYCMPRGFFSFT